MKLILALLFLTLNVMAASTKEEICAYLQLTLTKAQDRQSSATQSIYSGYDRCNTADDVRACMSSLVAEADEAQQQLDLIKEQIKSARCLVK